MSEYLFFAFRFYLGVVITNNAPLQNGPGGLFLSNMDNYNKNVLDTGYQQKYC